MNIVVAGGRDFTNTNVAFNRLAQHVMNKDTIVSGHASGADKLGELFARSHNLELKLFPADWEKYGKSAGPIRNRKMAKIADLVIVFWDLESRGTKSMIKETLAYNKNLIVYDYNGRFIELEKIKRLL